MQPPAGYEWWGIRSECRGPGAGASDRPPGSASTPTSFSPGSVMARRRVRSTESAESFHDQQTHINAIQHRMPSKIFVAVAGNIGSGKSSLTKLLSGHYGWEAYFESVADNPYLADFYANMDRWSF